MHRRLFNTNARIYALEKRMDMVAKSVTDLQANEAAVEGVVNNLVAEVAALQTQLAAGIDQGDDDAIAAVNVAMVALVARATAAGASGASGASGSTGASATGASDTTGASGAPVTA